MAGPGLFDYLDALMSTKTNLLQSDDPEMKKGFDPFMTRRGLAQNIDTLAVAQQMNELHSVDPWLQWNYALHSIPAKKRYGKWSKKGAMDPDLLLVVEYFGISVEKASDYLRFLPKEAIEEIRTKMGHESQNEKAKPKRAAKSAK